MRFRSNFSKVIAVIDLLYQKAIEQTFEKYDLRSELDMRFRGIQTAKFEEVSQLLFSKVALLIFLSKMTE